MQGACVNCGKTKTKPNQFWYLRNYYGMNGLHCCDCYALISHDGNGDPKNPTEYLMILLKQESNDGNASH